MIAIEEALNLINNKILIGKLGLIHSEISPCPGLEGYINCRINSKYLLSISIISSSYRDTRLIFSIKDDRGGSNWSQFIDVTPYINKDNIEEVFIKYIVEIISRIPSSRAEKLL